VRGILPAVGMRRAEWVRYAVRLATDPDVSGLVVCAWGTHGSFMEQDQAVLGWIEGLCEPMALGITKEGHPRHPLYVSYSAELVPSSGRRTAV
jgi:hypothetical protein